MRPLLPVLIPVVLIVGPAAAYRPDTLTVTFLDVGQGDAALIQAPNGRAMLVDAGESKAAPTVRPASPRRGSRGSSMSSPPTTTPTTSAEWSASCRR